MHDLHLALVHPEIPWNTGNTGRTCLALGAMLHLVRPLGFSLESREVRRAGLDYWERVALTVHESFDQFESELPSLGEAWFLSAEGARSLTEIRLHRPVVFVLGCETQGLPAGVREKYRDRLVRIPQRADQVRSLNLSTTAALAAYEYRRQFPLEGDVL